MRIITPDVGGGFGAKIGTYPEEIVLGPIAKRLGRPVRWQETRSESMMALGHGRAQVQHVTIGGSRDGTVTHYRLHVIQDAGAFCDMGAILAPFMTRPMSSGVYAIPNIECRTTSVVTNTTPTTAYRGAGRPEATAAIERAMDLFAAELGIDPADVRRTNLIAPFAEPHTTTIGQTYDVGDYAGALDKVLEAAGYAELRAEQARRRESGDPVQLGIGVSTYVEITGGVPPMGEAAKIEVLDDGRAVDLHRHVAARPGPRHVVVDDRQRADGHPDRPHRARVGRHRPRAGRRRHDGLALAAAGRRRRRQGRRRARRARPRRSPPRRWRQPRPTSSSTSTPAPSTSPARPPSPRSWGELAALAASDGEPLLIETRFEAGSPTFPFGAHVAVVEVDVETGQVRHVRHVACDDAGRVINPLILEGQIHGGVAQGAAQALLEEVRYDADGNPVTSNLADYGMITAAELPSFEIVHMETPTPVNPLGAKGIGESGTIGSTPAVQSAVVDAVSHLGVRHIDMPATAERVWQAIQAAS